MSDFTADTLIFCPHCETCEKTRKVWSIPTIIEDAKQPRTISELARKNTEDKVKRGELSKSALDADSNREKRKKLSEHYNDLNRMTPRQKRRYILEGKK